MPFQIPWFLPDIFWMPRFPLDARVYSQTRSYYESRGSSMPQPKRMQGPGPWRTKIPGIFQPRTKKPGIFLIQASQASKAQSPCAQPILGHPLLPPYEAQHVLEVDLVQAKRGSVAQVAFPKGWWIRNLKNLSNNVLFEIPFKVLSAVIKYLNAEAKSD